MFKNRHFLSLAGQIASGLFGFITFGTITRMSDRITFGNWIVFITAYTFFEMLRNGLIQTSLVKFLAGTDALNSRKINGAGWLISLAVTGIYLSTSLVFLCFHISDSGWSLFIRYGSLALLCSLPLNYSLWLLQVDFQFNRILVLRLFNQLIYLLLLLIQFTLHRTSLLLILYSFIAANLIPGIFSILAGWCRLKDIFHTDKESLLKIFHFGKFSMGTAISSNLLKSSDTFIIQALMGPYFVALYTAPQKMLELVEIPLRSFAATAIPQMAGHVNAGQKNRVAEIFEKYTGGISLMVIPFILVCMVFAGLIMHTLGGGQYSETAPTLRIFMVYALLMPLDRFLGISLDIVNKPALNFYKVMIMLGVNILGDFAAIRFFHSINMVALSSLLTFLAGIVIGRLFLKRYLNFSFSGIFNRGIKLVTEYAEKIRALPAGLSVHKS